MIIPTNKQQTNNKNRQTKKMRGEHHILQNTNKTQSNTNKPTQLQTNQIKNKNIECQNNIYKQTSNEKANTIIISNKTK